MSGEEDPASPARDADEGSILWSFDDEPPVPDSRRPAGTVEALLSGAANVPAEEPADMPHPAAAEDAADGGADAEAEDQPAEGDESS